MSVLLGDVYAASYTVPGFVTGTTITLTVTAPDGTISTPTVSTGATSSAAVPASQVGSYLLVWSASGAVTDVYQDQFSVIAPALDLVSLNDVRDQLNITPTDRSMDAKLIRFIKAATSVIENITGPILPASRTDVFDGETTYVSLPFRWVKSIQLVTETRGITNYTLTEQPLGHSTDAYAYTWDKTVNKIVRRAYGGAVAIFPPGTNVVSVTYTLGMTTIPDDIQMAAAELIRHWWQFGQQPFRGAFSAQPVDDGGLATVVGYAVPNRVLELLNPWRRHPAVF
jgi:hypothetical protein